MMGATLDGSRILEWLGAACGGGGGGPIWQELVAAV
jgi:hypothetical protein